MKFGSNPEVIMIQHNLAALSMLTDPKQNKTDKKLLKPILDHTACRPVPPSKAARYTPMLN